MINSRAIINVTASTTQNSKVEIDQDNSSNMIVVHGKKNQILIND